MPTTIEEHTKAIREAELIAQLKRIADALAEIAKFVDCSSSNWGRGF